MRLIDANAFECVCVNGKSDDFCNGVLYVLDMIDAQPTVEAVEVVRCKKCRYYIPDSDYCGMWGEVRHPEHYCEEGDSDV